MEAIKETLYDTLTHHGVKGQKWGVRRYQNYDGTLTAKGKENAYSCNIHIFTRRRKSFCGNIHDPEYFSIE